MSVMTPLEAIETSRASGDIVTFYASAGALAELVELAEGAAAIGDLLILWGGDQSCWDGKSWRAHVTCDALPQRYLVDGESPTTLGEFIVANGADFSAQEIRQFVVLRPGEVHHGGGGAAVDWTLTRVGDRASAKLLPMKVTVNVPADANPGTIVEAPIAGRVAHFVIRESPSGERTAEFLDFAEVKP